MSVKQAGRLSPLRSHRFGYPCECPTVFFPSIFSRCKTVDSRLPRPPTIFVAFSGSSPFMPEAGSLRLSVSEHPRLDTLSPNP